mgnify:CR=1 FL=1
MSKKLIIAEKPSVANDIARALGGFTRKGDYFESDDYVLSSAVGHLLELTLPAEHDVKKGKWSFAKLPVIPPHFDLAPIERNESRLNLLLRLLKRKDVTGVVNACDAGREGELIFAYIFESAGVAKPVQRLWISSMTKQAIKDGFEKLRPGETMRPLESAARAASSSRAFCSRPATCWVFPSISTATADACCSSLFFSSRRAANSLSSCCKRMNCG